MPPAARQEALANSSVAMANDVFAIFNNPGGIAQLKKIQVGAFYLPAPFGFKELSSQFVALELPLGSGNLGVGAMNYGFNLYRLMKLNLTFARSFLNKYFVGCGFSFYSLKISGYGNKTNFTFNLGFVALLRNYLKAGFSISNLFHQSFLKKFKSIPTIINFGIAYIPFKSLIVTFALCKDLDYPVSMRVGIEYNLLKYIFLRIGTRNYPDAFTAGIGVKFKWFRFDVAVFTHSYFPLTEQASLIIEY